jgi:hypothetical protein
MIQEHKEQLPMLTRLMIAASALVLVAACSNETPPQRWAQIRPARLPPFQQPGRRRRMRPQ